MCCMWRRPVKRDEIKISKSIGSIGVRVRGIFLMAEWDENSEYWYRTSKLKRQSKIQLTNRKSWAIGRVVSVWKQREHTMECAWNKSIGMADSVRRVPLNLLLAWHSCDSALLWLVFWPLVRVPQLSWTLDDLLKQACTRELSASPGRGWTRNLSYIIQCQPYDVAHLVCARSIYGLCAKRCLLPLPIRYLD